MSVPFSATASEVIQGLSASERPIALFEITHPLLSEPIRLAENTEDVVSNGATFIACAVRFVFPDDQDKSQPRAQLAFDNVSRHMGRVLEQTGGAVGAQLWVRQVLPSSPNVYERAVLKLRMSSISLSASTMSCELGYREALNLPATQITYRAENAPGLF